MRHRILQGAEEWGAPAVIGLVQAIVPALLMNVSIVGLNQLYDVEIDKVNKPYLPLASGEMTQSQVSSERTPPTPQFTAPPPSIDGPI